MREVKILFIFLLINSVAFSSKIEKGFERLKVFDYFRAKEYFEKSFKKETAASAFGLSSIFSNDKNPFYNTDSARKYILISDSAYNILKEKKKKYYSKFGITADAIHNLDEFICSVAFNKSKKANSVAEYNHFLKAFNSCAQFSEAANLRNAAAFAEVRRKNTSEAYKEFMAMYPNSEQYRQAMGKYEERIYNENTLDHTIEAYEFFIQNYPENSYHTQAEKMIYFLSVPDKTIGQYVNYVRNHKESRYADEAWHEVYKLSMKDYSAESFNKFKESFPDYPFPEELESDFRLQNYFFLPFEEKDKWGYINELGQRMINADFDEASFFSDGLAVIANDGRYGYIDKSGKIAIQLQFQDAESFHNGCAVVMKDSLYGLINRKGEFKIAPKYEELSEVSDDIYMAVNARNSGYLYKSGDSLTGFVFDFAGEFNDGYAIVNANNKYGLLNSGGFYNIEPKYSDLVVIGDGLLKAFNDEETWGIVNVQGDTILPFLYDAIGEMSENRVLVAKKDKCGYVNSKGEIVIPLTFRFTSILLTTGEFQNGFALLKQKYKSVIIDTTGKTISFSLYEDYGRPSEGLIPVRKNKKWGFTDMKGKLTISCKYEAAESFNKGLSIVRQNRMTGLIDTTGNYFILPLYDDISFSDNAIIIRRSGKSGLLTRAGSLLIPCLYERIEFLSPFIARATDAQGFTYVNMENGKIIYNSANE